MTLNGHQKKWHFPKTDSCNENAHLFFTFRTQIVFAYFSKKWQFYKIKTFFLTTTQKTLFFWAFFWHYIFPFFSCFLFFFFQHKIIKNKKCTFIFENPFLTPWQPAQKIIFAHLHTICVFKIPQKHYKTGEKNKQKKKSWTKFWRNLGPSFDSKNPKSWTKFWLYSIYIYV